IPRNEESHQVIQIMRFLVPQNDNILNKYSSIFKDKLALVLLCLKGIKMLCNMIIRCVSSFLNFKVKTQKSQFQFKKTDEY
ncbi:hypothetical protein, partial [Flavobacterium psychrophilum]|uniref:hypothetical protein n=3 Tax=Flavobacterium psychrophilum TaxID=96345 RepID=UPI001C0EF25B